MRFIHVSKEKVESIMNSFRSVSLIVLAIALVGCSSNEPKWASVNKKVIDQAKVSGRTRELPHLSVPSATESRWKQANCPQR